MEKAPITITATTIGRAQYNPGYTQREYMDKGDIPNHIAAMLAFVRQDLKPNEKVIVREGKLYIVEKSVFDKAVDWVAGRRTVEPAPRTYAMNAVSLTFLALLVYTAVSV